MDWLVIIFGIVGALLGLPLVGMGAYLLIMVSYESLKWLQAQADKFMMKKYISRLKKIGPKMTPKEIEKAEEEAKVNGFGMYGIPAWYEGMVLYVMSSILGLLVLGVIYFFRST
jgi:hypothetical protein